MHLLCCFHCCRFYLLPSNANFFGFQHERKISNSENSPGLQHLVEAAYGIQPHRLGSCQILSLFSMKTVIIELPSPYHVSQFNTHCNTYPLYQICSSWEPLLLYHPLLNSGAVGIHSTLLHQCVFREVFFVYKLRLFPGGSITLHLCPMLRISRLSK